MNLLLEDGAGISSWILPAVLIVVIVALMVMSYVRNKKMQNQAQEMVSNLKIGDKVKTYSGFYGKIVEIKESVAGKIVTIETGEGKFKGYMAIDINAIYGIADDKPVVYDAEGNVKENKPAEELKTVKETNAQEAKIKEAKVEDIKTEETKVEPKKASTKKKATTKTTKKSK